MIWWHPWHPWHGIHGRAQEEELMARKDFRVNELRNMSWTVEDPKKAVFYMAPGHGKAMEGW